MIFYNFRNYCNLFSFLLVSACALAFAPNCLADEDEFESEFENEFESMQQFATEDPVTFALLAEENSIQPGRPLWLAVDVSIVDGWHGYWKNPGSTGMPLRVEWNVPEGFTVGELQWPCPSRFEQSGLVGYGYDTQMTLLVQLTPPAQLPQDQKSFKIEADITWLVCSSSTCLPGNHTVSLELPLAASTPLKQNVSHFADAKSVIPSPTKNELSAREEKGTIELKIDLGNETAKFQTAEFFPARKGLINDSELPKITAQTDGKLSINLKAADGKPSEVLQGVLLLKGTNEKLSLEIDHPIELSADSIAMADQFDLNQENAGPREDPSQTLEGGIVVALIFAFLGGIILNLMPCVFPVISFKILSFVNMAGKSRKVTLLHGIAFSLGVLVSFWILAGLILVLSSYGHEAGWGFQLKEPLFVGVLILVLFIFAMSLFGVFEFGLSLTAIAGDAQQKVGGKSTGLVGSFFSGVLATALATPCTGPLMAPALGYAATLPAFGAILIFTFLGAGMAAPYLLLSAYPQYLRFLPRPGPWMTTFKQIMAFVLLATVLWLVNVFVKETGGSTSNLILIALFIAAVACWLFGHSCNPAKSLRSKRLGALVCALCMLMSGTLIYFTSALSSNSSQVAAQQSSGWENFTAARFKELRQQGRPVFIDFTAEWCMICQVNHWMISTNAVDQKFDEYNVVKMKADWTLYDPDITAMLRKFGRNGVPLYVLFSGDPNEAPQVLPQVLTPGIVIDAVNEMSPTLTAARTEDTEEFRQR